MIGEIDSLLAPSLLGITRSELQQVLWARLEALGCMVLAEARIEAITAVPSAVGVRLSTGATVEADIVIGADGMHSAVRRLLFAPEPPTDLGLAAWWGRTTLDAWPLDRGRPSAASDRGTPS